MLLNLNHLPTDQVLPLWARVDQGAMEMKGYSEFLIITVASPLDCLVSYPGHSLGWGLPLCREAAGVIRLGKYWKLDEAVCVLLRVNTFGKS